MGISACILSHRGLIKVSGGDRLAFLQGLLTNDVSKISPETAIYALLLSPQGRIHYDMMIHQQGDDWYIEADADRLPDLVKRLSIFKLRSDVALDIVLDKTILSLWGDDVATNLGLPQDLGACLSTSLWTCFNDPRLFDVGARVVVSSQSCDHLRDCLGFNLVEVNVYNEHRYSLGVPESAAELEFNRAIPLEYGMDGLGAIDWNKGCYMGQELTARTKYRGLVRKRVFPVRWDGFDRDQPLISQDKDIGYWIADAGLWALAMVRLEALNQEIKCGHKSVQVERPTWMTIAETDDES